MQMKIKALIPNIWTVVYNNRNPFKTHISKHHRALSLLSDCCTRDVYPLMYCSQYIRLMS